MATNRSIRGLSRAGFRVQKTSSNPAKVDCTRVTSVDVDDHKVQLSLAGERDNFVRVTDAGTCTISNATPAVVSKSGHGYAIGDIVTFSVSSGGSLPTGLTAGTKYYIIATSFGANSFKVSATYGGGAVNTSSAGSGTFTVTPASTRIVGITRRGFRVLSYAASNTKQVTANITQGVVPVDLTDYRVLRVLRRNAGQYLASPSATSVTIRGQQNQQNGFEISEGTAAGSSVLTSTNTDVTAGKVVTIGDQTYTFVSALTEAYATAVLTSDNTNITAATPATALLTTDNTEVADGDTVTIGAKTYRIVDTMSQVNDVQRHGTTADTTLLNLAKAINAVNGSGTAWFAGTTANASVSATETITSHHFPVTAKDASTAGNAVVTTTTATHLSWPGGTLNSGTARVAGDTVTVGTKTYEFYPDLTGPNNAANHVLKGADADTSLLNLARAINHGGTPGVEYGTATTANADATSTAIVTAHAITLTATALGTDGNSVAKAETSSHLDFDGVGAVFTGGVDPVVDEVKVDGTADGSLTNLSRAINAGTGEGSSYSTGTTANVDATASAVGVPAAHKITIYPIEGDDQTIDVSTDESTLSFAPATVTDVLVKIYRGVQATVNPSVAAVYTQLRRHFKSYLTV